MEHGQAKCPVDRHGQAACHAHRAGHAQRRRRLATAATPCVVAAAAPRRRPDACLVEPGPHDRQRRPRADSGRRLRQAVPARPGALARGILHHRLPAAPRRGTGGARAAVRERDLKVGPRQRLPRDALGAVLQRAAARLRAVRRQLRRPQLPAVPVRGAAVVRQDRRPSGRVRRRGPGVARVRAVDPPGPARAVRRGGGSGSPKRRRTPREAGTSRSGTRAFDGR